jgi:hypothetical protein
MLKYFRIKLVNCIKTFRNKCCKLGLLKIKSDRKQLLGANPYPINYFIILNVGSGYNKNTFKN